MHRHDLQPSDFVSRNTLEQIVHFVGSQRQKQCRVADHDKLAQLAKFINFLNQTPPASCLSLMTEMPFYYRNHVVEMVRLGFTVVDRDRGDNTLMPLAHHLMAPLDRIQHLAPLAFDCSSHGSQAVVYPRLVQDFQHFGYVPTHVRFIS
jgi:hypothetical protein